jgi:hypothetical protein
MNDECKVRERRKYEKEATAAAATDDIDLAVVPWPELIEIMANGFLPSIVPPRLSSIR